MLRSRSSARWCSPASRGRPDGPSPGHPTRRTAPASTPACSTRPASSALLASGVDRHEVEVTAAEDGQFEVEAILSAAQADQLAASGAELGRPTAPRPAAPRPSPRPCSVRTAGREACRRSSPRRPPPTRHRQAGGDRQDHPGQGHQRRAGHPQRRPHDAAAAGRRPSTSAPSTPVNGSRRRWSGGCSTTS